MGATKAPLINEAIFLLHKLDPKSLENLRQKFPSLGEELSLGLLGGVKHDELNKDRAQVMLVALDVAKRKAENELPVILRKMRKAKKFRLFAQIATLIFSSGVLASLPFGPKALTVIPALLTLLASIGTIVSEYQERLLKQGDGDIYDAYEKANHAAYRASLMCEEIRLLVKHGAENSEICIAISSANELCEELVKLTVRMKGSK